MELAFTVQADYVAAWLSDPAPDIGWLVWSSIKHAYGGQDMQLDLNMPDKRHSHSVKVYLIPYKELVSISTLQLHKECPAQ
jgi:hypothetical protein